MSKWESRRRLDFIEDQLAEHGIVTRRTVADFFGVSHGIAGEDIMAYRKANKSVVYDARLKAFRWKDPAAPRLVRGSSTVRRAIWSILQP